MSKPSYTPGPWNVYHENGSMGSSGHWGVEMSGETHSITICTMSHRDNARHNARLIASAPEMAEWIRKVVSYTTAPMADGGIEQEDIDRARALLAEVGE